MQTIEQPIKQSEQWQQVFPELPSAVASDTAQQMRFQATFEREALLYGTSAIQNEVCFEREAVLCWRQNALGLLWVTHVSAHSQQ